jgi:adenylate cyclase
VAMLAVPLFALPDLAASREFALEETVTTLLAGLSTSAAGYLTRECQLRPAFALALDRSAPPEARSLGIGPRLLLTWVLCSGVPILMVALIPVGREVTDPKDLIAPIWFAAGAAMGAGFIATKLATQAVARPVRRLRRAIDAVTKGDLDVSVPVDDGSEVGRLQLRVHGRRRPGQRGGAPHRARQAARRAAAREWRHGRQRRRRGGRPLVPRWRGRPARPRVPDADRGSGA